MPPENEVKPWMLIYYSPEYNYAPDKYWKEIGKLVYALLNVGLRELCHK